MSASYLVDLKATTQHDASYSRTAVFAYSGDVTPGGIIGIPVDLRDANTFTKVFLAARTISLSGDLHVAVQTSDTDVSGNFTDPTSGLPSDAFPTQFISGGITVFNSGGADNVIGGGRLISGFFAGLGAFQRPHRYARLNLISGSLVGAVVMGFIGQLKTTGSGGGFYTSSGIGAPPTV